jgi:hypothetical protein
MSMPRMDGIVKEDGYATVSVPVLNVTGTCDTSIIYRTFPKHRRIPFQVAPPSQQNYLITLRGVNHNTFSNRHDEHHPLIAELVILFARAFLQDDAAAKAWFNDTGSAMIGRTQLTLERK